MVPAGGRRIPPDRREHPGPAQAELPQRDGVLVVTAGSDVPGLEVGIVSPVGKRVGRAEEIASAIVWLLSDEASYTTGALLDVAGGR